MNVLPYRILEDVLRTKIILFFYFPWFISLDVEEMVPYVQCLLPYISCILGNEFEVFSKRKLVGVGTSLMEGLACLLLSLDIFIHMNLYEDSSISS